MGVHAGKVSTDGPLPLARVQSGIVRSGTGGRSVGRNRRIRLGRRQRRHLTKQISQVVHRVRCELLTYLYSIYTPKIQVTW